MEYDFFHETTAFTHTMYFFKIRRIRFRRIGTEPTASQTSDCAVSEISAKTTASTKILRARRIILTTFRASSTPVMRMLSGEDLTMINKKTPPM